MFLDLSSSEVDTSRPTLAESFILRLCLFKPRFDSETQHFIVSFLFYFLFFINVLTVVGGVVVIIMFSQSLCACDNNPVIDMVDVQPKDGENVGWT